MLGNLKQIRKLLLNIKEDMEQKKNLSRNFDNPSLVYACCPFFRYMPFTWHSATDSLTCGDNAFNLDNDGKL